MLAHSPRPGIDRWTAPLAGAAVGGRRIDTLERRFQAESGDRGGVVSTVQATGIEVVLKDRLNIKPRCKLSQIVDFYSFFIVQLRRAGSFQLIVIFVADLAVDEADRQDVLRATGRRSVE